VNEFPFHRSRRLLKKAEFDRVFARRRSQGDGILVLYACENDLCHSRIGLVVSRKAGNAVVRARWKRCLREAFRLAQHELPQGLDLVALPRVGAAPTMPRIEQSLRTLSERLARQLR
jgi:ribonuclease P protein component